MPNRSAILLITILVFSCEGKQELESNIEARDLLQIRRSGVLNVMMENSSIGFHEQHGKLVGFEYELMKEFAQSLGLKLNVIKVRDLDSVFYYIKNGKADIAAAGLTITNARLKHVSFSEPYMYTRQVLVQRKPKDWEQMDAEKINRTIVKDVVALGDKTITVRRNSSFYSRLKSFLDETGTKIILQPAPGSYSTEKLIELVSSEKIEMTIADEHVAKMSSLYYSNLDIRTTISLKQKIGWALNKKSEDLLEELNCWLQQKAVKDRVAHLTRKYFERNGIKPIKKDLNLPGALEQMVKIYSRQYGWDWRFIAAIIKAESGGDHFVRSWAGATGLMQLMPETAAKYGTDQNSTPAENIRAGILYLSELDRFWKNFIKDPRERTFFVVASYNSGPGHLLDARRLALKYGANPDLWEGNVKEWLVRKEDPAVFCDEEVRHGFCYGSVTARYVEDVIGAYYSMISKDERTIRNLARVTQ